MSASGMPSLTIYRNGRYFIPELETLNKDDGYTYSADSFHLAGAGRRCYAGQSRGSSQNLALFSLFRSTGNEELFSLRGKDGDKAECPA